MKRVSLIAILTSIMIMLMSAFTFAADGDLKLVTSYPQDGQKNTSIENLGVKLTFNNPINADKFKILDEDGKEVPIQVLFSNKNDGLVLVVADTDKGFTAANNAEYVLHIDGDLVDNDGNTLGKDQTISFKTYNQRVNNIVNMAMMFVMFGGIMVISMRQNNQKKEDEADKKKEENKEVFNPYREAKRTGKTVEEVMEEQAKKEEKEAKKRARKKKKEAPAEKKIENCAQYLKNVYHVHAPAPISKEDRSIEALRELRKGSKSKKSQSKKK